MSTWFRARITGTLPDEGATLVAAELLEGAAAGLDAPERESLVYMDRRWHRLRENSEGVASIVSLEEEYRDVFR